MRMLANLFSLSSRNSSQPDLQKGSSHGRRAKTESHPYTSDGNGIQVDKPIFTLIWQDVARVMVETEGFEMAADFPTDVLVNMLNTIEDGLEYLDWYDNIQNSLRLADRTPLPQNPATTKDKSRQTPYQAGSGNSGTARVASETAGTSKGSKRSALGRK